MGPQSHLTDPEWIYKFVNDKSNWFHYSKCVWLIIGRFILATWRSVCLRQENHLQVQLLRYSSTLKSTALPLQEINSHSVLVADGRLARLPMLRKPLYRGGWCRGWMPTIWATKCHHQHHSSYRMANLKIMHDIERYLLLVFSPTMRRRLRFSLFKKSGPRSGCGKSSEGKLALHTFTAAVLIYST